MLALLEDTARKLTDTLDSVFPMPTSKTDYRIANWLYDARENGLITETEWAMLYDYLVTYGTRLRDC